MKVTKYHNLQCLGLIALTFFLCRPTLAVQDFNDDIRINQGTPALIFNDSDDAGLDFYILGRQASFNVKDHATEVDVFSYWKSGRRATFGYSAAATASSSLAIGNEALASGFASAALGVATLATAEHTIAIGVGAESSGSSSIALGRLSESTSISGLALGNFSRVIGDYGTAVGAGSEASATDGTAIGEFSRATGESSLAAGSRSLASGYGSVALGPGAFADQDHTVILGSIEGINFRNHSSQVGIGTTQPQAPLHIHRFDETQQLLRLTSNEVSTPQDRAMMYLENNGGIRFEFRDKNQATGWRFQSQTGLNDRFEITKVGSGEIEMEVRKNGNLFIAGNLFTNSDVNTKQDIDPVNGDDVLARVANLPISEWSYKDAAEHRHIGPMAQDFHAAFGLGEGETTLTATDLAGVSLAAVQALHAENQDLRQRLSALEALVQTITGAR